MSAKWSIAVFSNRRAFFISVLFYCLMGSFPLAVTWAEDPPTMTLISPKHAALIDELTQKHGFDTAFVAPLFSEIVIRPEIMEKFERPAEKLTYSEYKNRFFRDRFVAKGLLYFEENKPLLQKIENDWEVPKEIIAAILGVETRFGEPGIEKYRVWDILNTAYLLFTRREAFYKDEIIAFLTLCKEEGLDPLQIKGSYAGAMGVPQFMPSSFLKSAMDYDGDRKRNLWTSRPDIYASVANYLKKAGWKINRPIRIPVKMTGNPATIQKVIEAGIRKTLSLAEATKIGIEVPDLANPEEELSFTSYSPEPGKDLFVALFSNFRVITSYNFSSNYALLVTELSEILAKGEVGLTPEGGTP